jgi:hypothetical protein
MSQTIPFGRTLLVTTIVAIGIAAAWTVSSLWAAGIAQSAMQSREAYERIYASVTGEPVIVRTSRSGQTTEQILSLAGEPRKLTSQDVLYPQYVAGPDEISRFVTAPDWNARLVAINDGGIPPTFWYLVHDGHTPGDAYGIGFHSQTRQTIGYFGRGGFRDTLPPRDEWFHIPGNQGVSGVSTMGQQGREPHYGVRNPRALLIADGKLWKIDLAKKELKPLLDCPQAYRLGQVWLISDKPPVPDADADQYSASSITRSHAVVRDRESLLVVNPQSGESKRFPIPAFLRDSMLAGAVLPDGNLLLIGKQNWNDNREQVVWLHPAGEIVKQQEVRLAGSYSQPSVAAIGWQVALSAPFSVATAIFAGTGPLALLERKEAATYAAALRILLMRTWPSMLAVLAVASAVAVLAYRRQKRFGLPNAGWWAAFVFLLGIPGWIAYRFHRIWPVLEECPSCRQPSPRDRTACLDCGASFPPPPLKGIEVFA